MGQGATTEISTVHSWLRDGRRLACGLLVDVEGSAPVPKGATMLIDEYGSIEGSITGGCVESAVVQEAEAVLAGASARVRTYGISDEMAGTVGLSCGGAVHVFIFELGETAIAAELAVIKAVADDRPATIATLLDGEHAGSELAIIDNELIASLGSPALGPPGCSRRPRCVG